MFCEKKSDEIDHCKNFGHQKVFSIFIQKIDLFSSIFPQNDDFFLKNLRNLRHKIFEASKWKWAEDEDEDGSSAKNLRRTKIFEASLQHCHPPPLTFQNR